MKNKIVQKIYLELNNIFGEEPIYLVGGSVRDIIMNKEPKDYDFTTALTPEVIEEKIHKVGKKVYTIGKRFGTIGVKIEDQLVEITTFRTEKYEEGNRKPNVEFVTTLEEDLSRRDFTINAMAIKQSSLIEENDSFTIIDPFSGIKDLGEKLIRTVGNPIKRFREDPLRLLRAIRFVNQFDGFTLEFKTFEAIIEKNYKILQISKERWMQELDKILLFGNPSIGLDLLAETKLLNFMIPELSLQVGYNQNNPHHQHNLWDHTLRVVDKVPKDINMRWAALLHDVAKPFVRNKKEENHYNYHKHDMLGADLTERIARHLKWSNERREVVVELVKHHMDENSPLKQYDREAK
jgi:tRNA nucleotidyltransferase (CCA-adding enzyme)